MVPNTVSMIWGNLFGIIVAISLRRILARPAETGTRPSVKATSPTSRPPTPTGSVLVDPELFNFYAGFNITQPRSDGELLTSPELFEGDILGIDPEMIDIRQPTNNRTKFRDTDSGGIPTWPDNLIPYVISKIFRPKDKQAIRDALQDFMFKTTVKFREKEDSDDEYVYIAPGYGCASDVGRGGGKQLLVLQVPGCLNRGYIHHELMHTLGFYHEQSRDNRDEYVEINWNNIPKAQYSSFQSRDTAYNLNNVRPYDIASLMHYGMYDFAIDKRVWTIRPKASQNNTREAAQMGQRKGLSAVDVEKVKLAYPKGVIHPGTRCPTGSGWTKHRNKCYFFSFLADTLPRNFTSADSFCQAMDARITSEPGYSFSEQFFTVQMRSLNSGARIYVADCRTISPVNVNGTQTADCSTELHFICAKDLVMHTSSLSVPR